MIYEMYTVFDKAVRAYLPPFYCRSRGEALRSFTAAVNEKDHQFNKYVSDYTLYFVGTFDDHGAVVVAHEPQRIISAVEVSTDDVFNQSNMDDGVVLTGSKNFRAV